VALVQVALNLRVARMPGILNPGASQNYLLRILFSTFENDRGRFLMTCAVSGCVLYCSQDRVIEIPTVAEPSSLFRSICVSDGWRGLPHSLTTQNSYSKMIANKKRKYNVRLQPVAFSN